MSKFTLDDIMRKVQAMLDRADHPGTPPAEADSARAMAEKYMRQYRIEESELIAAGALADEQSRPGSKHITVCSGINPFLSDYWACMVYIAQHAGVRITYKFTDNENGEWSLMAVVVGYEADIRLAEMLYTSARLTFADRMEPKYDPNQSDEDNVYRLRSSGMERNKISEVMGWGADGTNGPVKVTRVYKRACAARGEEPILTGKGMSLAVFREQYAAGFKSELYGRLYRARNAADSSTGTLVLANRKENVDEAFYQLFPNLRPSTEPVVVDNKPRKVRKTTKADMKRAERAYSLAGQAGASAGRKAAQEIEINGAAPTKRIN